MTGPIEIGPARPDEIPAIAQLAARLVEMHHIADPGRFFLPDDTAGGYVRWLSQEVERAEVALLVARRGQRLVGYAYGQLEPRNWNQLLDAHASMQELWVEPEERSRGVGSALLAASLASLRAMGAPRVVLFVAATNRSARTLFEHVGFRPTMVEMTREL
jgi:ribosomal protein S18 acetylase RimI-like enzyme